MLKGIRQQGIVGKDGKIEIQASELSEGTVVEVIILIETELGISSANQETTEDTTEYLLSNETNHQHLMESIQQAENPNNLIRFTPEEWNEKYNIHS